MDEVQSDPRLSLLEPCAPEPAFVAGLTGLQLDVEILKILANPYGVAGKPAFEQLVA